MTKYIFDVDGTLTPSRQKINKEFELWLKEWGSSNEFYLVTGSDRDKTVEQLRTPLYNTAIKAYQCSGNDVWQRDQNVSRKDIKLPQGLLAELDKALISSKFYVKTGGHIDYRPGLVNFSIVGRRCKLEERAMYRQWDQHKNERRSIARKLGEKFPGFNFQIAGETGIDITKKGSDKSQILNDFDHDDVIYFFGDSCGYGGNDYEIAEAVKDRNNSNLVGGSRVFEVKGWMHTWKILKELSA